MEDVVDLAADLLRGRLVGRDHGVRGVAHVHERTPLPAAAVQQEPPVQERVLHEGVHHQVEAHARAPAVDGAVAHDHGGEPLAGQPQERLLAVALGGRVGGARVDRRLLVVHAGRQAVVERARGGEHVAVDPVLDAALAQRLRAERVHLPVRLGVVLRRRVVRQAGEVDHALHAVEGVVGDVADVRHDELDLVAERADRILAEVQPVQHANPVAALEQLRDEDAADVSGAARDEHGLTRPGRLHGQPARARGVGGSGHARQRSGLCWAWMRRTLSVLAALLVAAVAAPASASGADRLVTAVQDPLDTAFHEPDPGSAYQVARGLGASVVRVPVGWNTVAPTRPATPTDPADPAYNWSRLDQRVAAIHDAGLEPLLVLYAAPLWARRRERNGTRSEAPHTRPFADFAAAAARRYDGTRPTLPRVRYWQIWNEPNHAVYFSVRRGPQRYRAILNAAYRAIHAVALSNTVVAGGLSPFGGGDDARSPLGFMRGLLCISRGSRPRATCRARTHFDAWSHHPYTSGGPTHEATERDDASLGDLSEMRSLLEVGPARKSHRLSRSPGVLGDGVFLGHEAGRPLGGPSERPRALAG